MIKIFIVHYHDRPKKKLTAIIVSMANNGILAKVLYINNTWFCLSIINMNAMIEAVDSI